MPPPPIQRMVERAYSITPVLPSVGVRDGISNLHLSFSGVSNLHLSFQAGASMSSYQKLFCVISRDF